jgi:hypothetical protein
MTEFDNREASVEQKFVLDEDARFKAGRVAISFLACGLRKSSD